MTITNIFFSFILTVAFISCKKENTKTDFMTNLLNEELDTLLSHSEINALSVGVYIEGKTYELHRGELTKGMKNRPNEETLYEIASLTKTFTGTLLAKAIVDNKVSLDDDIRTVLKGSFPNLEYEKKPITFRHLVTHRSGIPHMFPDKPEIFENPNYETLPYIINNLQKNFTKQMFFDELHKVKLDTIPGAKFGYSNAGANLLGYCLENIYDKSFEDILKHNILTPLKMGNTKIVLSDKEEGDLAQGYNEKNMKMPFGVVKDMSAEGGIKSTLSDMMKYVAYHLEQNNDVINTSHQELLHLWDDFDNGLFWQIIKAKDKPVMIFQNGGAFGTSSWLTLIPEKKIGVFIITNESDPKTHSRLNETVNKILGKLK